MQETVKKEYIEREAVLIYAKMLVHTAYERKEKITDEEIEKLVYGIHADFTGAELGSIPAADVVEVVRCPECKHSYEDIGGLYCSYGVCVDCVVLDDFFCKYGERKGGDE